VSGSGENHRIRRRVVNNELSYEGWKTGRFDEMPCWSGEVRESGLTGLTRNHVSPYGSRGSNPPFAPSSPELRGFSGTFSEIARLRRSSAIRRLPSDASRRGTRRASRLGRARCAICWPGSRGRDSRRPRR
jgi:hypothetical protein